MKIQITYMYVTYPGGRQSFASTLRAIPDELPERPPEEKQIKELDPGRAASLIQYMLTNGKSVFVDDRLLAPILTEITDYLTSEMLCRLYCVEPVQQTEAAFNAL